MIEESVTPGGCRRFLFLGDAEAQTLMSVLSQSQTVQPTLKVWANKKGCHAAMPAHRQGCLCHQAAYCFLGWVLGAEAGGLLAGVDDRGAVCGVEDGAAGAGAGVVLD
jgi:hypothetical protein